jgi:hypothetical protein
MLLLSSSLHYPTLGWVSIKKNPKKKLSGKYHQNKKQFFRCTNFVWITVLLLSVINTRNVSIILFYRRRSIFIGSLVPTTLTQSILIVNSQIRTLNFWNYFNSSRLVKKINSKRRSRGCLPLVYGSNFFLFCISFVFWSFQIQVIAKWGRGNSSRQRRGLNTGT